MENKETLEETTEIKRNTLYDEIYSFIKQIPRKDVDCDAMDAPSCAYEIEQLFYKHQAYLIDALKGVESIIDNDNPSHEDIWRIANSAIEQFKKTKQ